MATYIVTAPLVIAKNEEGADLYVYEGGPVPDGQSDEWTRRHLDQGMIAEGEFPADAADPAGGRPSRRSKSAG